jgi:hypothetical protein
MINNSRKNQWVTPDESRVLISETSISSNKQSIVRESEILGMFHYIVDNKLEKEYPKLFPRIVNILEHYYGNIFELYFKGVSK